MARTTEELLAQHLSGIAAAEAYRVSGDPDLAEDAAQEALIRALANARQLQKPQRFGEWLGTIARNEAVDCLRRRRDVLVDADMGEPGPEFAAPEPTLRGADETSSDSDATRLAREAISRLPGTADPVPLASATPSQLPTAPLNPSLYLCRRRPRCSVQPASRRCSTRDRRGIGRSWPACSGPPRRG